MTTKRVAGIVAFAPVVAVMLVAVVIGVQATAAAVGWLWSLAGWGVGLAWFAALVIWVREVSS